MKEFSRKNEQNLLLAFQMFPQLVKCRKNHWNKAKGNFNNNLVFLELDKEKKKIS